MSKYPLTTYCAYFKSVKHSKREVECSNDKI